MTAPVKRTGLAGVSAVLLLPLNSIVCMVLGHHMHGGCAHVQGACMGMLSQTQAHCRRILFTYCTVLANDQYV